MNRFAAAHPEDWEDRFDAMYEQADHIRKERRENPEYEQVSNEPCRCCGETTTKGGRTCKRCSDSLEDERSRHVPGRDA